MDSQLMYGVSDEKPSSVVVFDARTRKIVTTLSPYGEIADASAFNGAAAMTDADRIEQQQQQQQQPAPAVRSVKMSGSHLVVLYDAEVFVFSLDGAVVLRAATSVNSEATSTIVDIN